MDPNNTITNPLGSTPSIAVPTVDEPVGAVGTTVPQPIEPVAEEPAVAEPVSATNPMISGEPTVPEPVAVDPMASVTEPSVGVEEPIAEETVEPTTGVVDTTGLGGVTKPTV